MAKISIYKKAYGEQSWSGELSGSPNFNVGDTIKIKISGELKTAVITLIDGTLIPWMEKWDYRLSLKVPNGGEEHFWTGHYDDFKDKEFTHTIGGEAIEDNFEGEWDIVLSGDSNRISADVERPETVTRRFDLRFNYEPSPLLSVECRFKNTWDPTNQRIETAEKTSQEVESAGLIIIRNYSKVKATVTRITDIVGVPGDDEVRVPIQSVSIGGLASGVRTGVSTEDFSIEYSTIGSGDSLTATVIDENGKSNTVRFEWSNGNSEIISQSIEMPQITEASVLRCAGDGAVSTNPSENGRIKIIVDNINKSVYSTVDIIAYYRRVTAGTFSYGESVAMSGETILSTEFDTGSSYVIRLKITDNYGYTSIREFTANAITESELPNIFEGDADKREIDFGWLIKASGGLSGAEITEDYELNGLTAPGIYYCNNKTITISGSLTPYNTFCAIVLGDGERLAAQIIIYSGGSRIRFGTCTNNNWSWA